MSGLDTLTHTHTHTHTHTLALNGARSSPKFGTFGTRACAKLELWNSIWNTILRMRSVIAYCKGVAEKDPLVSRCEAMPKAGPSPFQWKRRLEAFARGEYAFSTGQKPRKGSRWHKVLCAIEDCPRQGKPASAKDPFGKPLVCKCGYHKISTKVSKTCR